MLNLNDDVSFVPRVGLKNAKKLNSLEIYTVEDLLYYFPFRYQDFSLQKDIIDINPEETVTIRGIVTEIKSIPLRNRRVLTEIYIQDQTASIKAVWFSFVLPLKFIRKGKHIQLSGKVSLRKGKELYFQHPNFELISSFNYENPDEIINSSSKTGSTNGLSPVYSENRQITSYFLRRIMQEALQQVEPKEFIPTNFLKEQDLPLVKKAFQDIHFPKNKPDSELAKKRFAFEKMFLIQIKSLETKQKWEKNQATSINFNEKLIKNFVANLPFELTDAQKKTSWQIIKDLAKNQPMNRLLEGDVGSGKTIVAVMASLLVLSKGFQVALLAPTEVLAIQHYLSISALLKKYQFKIGILTGSCSKINDEKISKPKFKERLSSQEIDLVIGTHAIIQNKINFKKLALIIIDEQHRFGVKQRAFLQQNTIKESGSKRKIIPHLLTMTATPIPRTLSLAVFGNLDLSIIDEYPKGKKTIITKVVLPSQREQIYNFIRSEVAKDKQVFIICPLVEESSKMNEVKSAKEEFEKLQNQVFPNLSLGLLHGRMKPKDKGLAMQGFKDKKFDILVSTAVVEVGIDIPNATTMIIEGAERFGLAQLHQFRGRVGRGADQSYCFLFTSSNIQATSRLKIMEKTNNGFKISEADLKVRGPGQFLGTLQSGNPDVAMESLSDVKLIQSTRLYAQSIIKYDPTFLKLPLLKNKFDLLSEKIHQE